MTNSLKITRKITPRITICVLANQLLSSDLASGGDVLAFEVLRRFKDNITIVAPKTSYHRLRRIISRAKFISSDDLRFNPQPNFIGGIEILFRYFLRSFAASRLIIKNRKFQVLYLTGDFICNSIPAAIYKLIYPKAIVISNFYHLNPSPWKRENRFLFSLASFLLQRFSLFLIRKISNHVFVLSSEGRNALIALGFNPGIITISGAGVTTRNIKIVDITRKYDLLFVGRLNLTKGIYDAIKILEKVKNSHPNVKMAVVGSCSTNEMKTIKRQLEQYRLNKNFDYLGFVNDINKNKLMGVTPILVAPSHEEGFGMGILEGIANGMKVVAYDLPVYKTIFNKYNKRIKYAPLGNADEMARIISGLLEDKIISNTTLKVPTWEGVAKLQEDVILRQLNRIEK